MAHNILKRLVNNTQLAIDNGVYDVDCDLQKSSQNFLDKIKTNRHNSIITEIKFASPSLGKIRTLTDPVLIAQQMIQGGASALSILTQPYLFNGSPEYFIKVRTKVDVPLLMKDIMIDKIQIDAAQKMGADYILVIQSLYEKGHLKNIDDFIAYGHKKGLSILVEAHTRDEFRNALKTDADIIGINNRNLDTLDLHLETTGHILQGFEKTRPILAESGINTPQDITYLKRCGADAFLVGSSIMQNDDIVMCVKDLVRQP